MTFQSKSIAWATGRSNPIRGCTKCDPGCTNCYAGPCALSNIRKGQDDKYGGTVDDKGNWTGQINVDYNEMDAIRTFKTKRCFVDSMSDTFHSNVSDADLTRLLDSCAANDKGTNWLLLTKRAERLAEISQGYSFSKKIWMGVSVCTKATGFPRLDALRKTRAAIMWASVEPFLEAVDLSPWLADGSLNWVVVGGESGPNHRPCNPEWIRAIRDQCANHNVPFFFKQFSGARPAKHPLLDGVQYEQYPHDDFHKE